MCCQATLSFPVVSHYVLYPEFECRLLNISNERFTDGQTKCPEQTPPPSPESPAGSPRSINVEWLIGLLSNL